MICRMSALPATARRLAAVAALLAAPGLALAQSNDGEVRKIDAEHGRITLKHAGIKKLDMPPMASGMVFGVSDRKLLDGLAVGDKVRFDADKVGGQYTVTALTKR
jgi:Cu(I)/Ag(I) efflux system protein CusF